MKKELMQKIRYSDLFWLFMAGSLFGVLMEGVFCLFRYGHWETHTVAVWGPFCILYGFGAVFLHVGAVFLDKKSRIVRFLFFMISATVLELLCGELVKHGVHMRAWDYSRQLFNIDGLVCPVFSIIWGVAGIIYAKYCAPVLMKIFPYIRDGRWNIACIGLSIFMAINLLVTGICIFRWSQRHMGISAKNRFERYIDRTWDDERMARRFCEWHFIDE